MKFSNIHGGDSPKKRNEERLAQLRKDTPTHFGKRGSGMNGLIHFLDSTERFPKLPTVKGDSDDQC